MAEYLQISDGRPDGCVIGRTTLEKVGFYGTIPVVQPSSSDQAAVTNTATGTVTQTATGTVTQTATGAVTQTAGDSVSTAGAFQFLSYGYAQAQANDIVARVNQLIVDVATYKTQIDKLTVDVATYKAQIDKLTVDVTTYKAQIDKLTVDGGAGNVLSTALRSALVSMGIIKGS